MAPDGSTEIYGIIGNPVAHSLSPAMHNAAFAARRMNRVYVAFPVTEVREALSGIKALGIKGASVTIPHKQAVIPHLDHIDPVAEKIGAVNTLVVRGNAITGYNTDWLGAVNAIEQHATLAGKKVTLLGAGGSARAIGFGLLEARAQITIASRTPASGKALAKELGCPWIPISEAGDREAQILINATSVGMAPNTDSPLPGARLSRFEIVMDIVYSPLETPLLRQAKADGCRTINGLAMLLLQGAAQFELWTGEEPPLQTMAEVLEKRFA